MDGLAQTHVVGQNGPAGADCESDAVELIGQERDLDESREQRMLCGIPANFADEAADSLLVQPLLDEFLRIGIDVVFAAGGLELLEAAQKGARRLDRPLGVPLDDLCLFGG